MEEREPVTTMDTAGFRDRLEALFSAVFPERNLCRNDLSSRLRSVRDWANGPIVSQRLEFLTEASQSHAFGLPCFRSDGDVGFAGHRL